MAKDKDAQLRNLIAAYGNSIRLSDIKAIIAVLFVAIMMGTVLQFRDLYPWYLSVPVILTPFMIIFLNLLISVYPRFPRAGRRRFPIWRNPHPEDFDFVADTEANSTGSPRDARFCRASSGGRTSRCRRPIFCRWPLRGGSDPAVRRTALSAARVSLMLAPSSRASIVVKGVSSSLRAAHQARDIPAFGRIRELQFPDGSKSLPVRCVGNFAGTVHKHWAFQDGFSPNRPKRAIVPALFPG